MTCQASNTEVTQDLGVVPQSDLRSPIIVSRCYNDLNLFHETLAYGHRRLRLKIYNR